MGRFTLTLLLLVLTGGPPMAAVASHEAPARQSAAQQTGLILGQVVDAVSGQPVASAQVRAETAGGQRFMPVLTGPDGHFVFSHLDAAEFVITANRPGYLEGAYGRRRPGGSHVALRLEDEERRGDVTIELWPEASISGRVLDDQARPLPGATVSVVDGRSGTPGSAADAVKTVTAADGTYRIDGLPPGRYLVAVFCSARTTPIEDATDPVAAGAVQFPAAPGDAVVSVSTDGERFTVFEGPVRDGNPAMSPTIFVTTWFGGRTRDADLRFIDLTSGEDRTGIDITMQVAPASRVRGRVAGVGERRSLVRLFPPDQDLTAMGPGALAIAEAVTTSDGLFEMPSVPAGPYLLYAYGLREPPRVSVSTTGVPRARGAPRPDDEGTWAMRFVDVGTAGEQTLAVSLRPGITVTGRLESSAVPAQDMNRPLVELGSQSTAVTPGTGFEFASLRPGAGQVTVSRLPQAPFPWVVHSVSLGGRDVTGLPYRLGDDVTDLVVTIGPGATIDGRLADDGDAPEIAATAIVLFPSNANMWWSMAETTDRIRIARPDPREFSFSSVPPGDYYLAAVDDAALADWPAQRLLERLAAVATRLTVEPGEVHAPVLRLTRSFR